MEQPKIRIEDCNWNDISKKAGRQIAVLPWGSCEPHGEHLSYCTDTILATIIADEAIMKTNAPSTFMMLPPISYGSQNFGQYDKKYCVHLSIESQKSILRDIVSSLTRQYISKLVIINGHNGNNFKTIVRDLELEFDIDIYVCNYLDIADKKFMETIEGSKELDDHAGFTETSLMLHYRDNFVNMENLDMNAYDIYAKTKEGNSFLWTPRNWDEYSCNTRIGDPRSSNKEAGRLIAEHIVEVLSKELNKILNFEL